MDDSTHDNLNRCAEAVVDRLGRALALPACSLTKVHCLLEGLLDAIERAPLVVVSCWTITPDDQVRAHSGLAVPGHKFAADDLDALLSQEAADAAIPIVHAVLPQLRNAPGIPVTWKASACYPDARWYESTLYAQFYKPLECDDAFSMAWLVNSSTIMNARIFRQTGSTPFTPHECTMASLFFRALIPFVTPATLAEQGDAVHDLLTVAQQQVLHLALTGISERDIAGKLHRSQHTVHSHLKEIYRRFNVGSRPELMALFIDHAAIARRSVVDGAIERLRPPQHTLSPIAVMPSPS
ncbi:MAG: helix-turn-helix transcriptional regulator [Planctomycetota bacterium]